MTNWISVQNDQWDISAKRTNFISVEKGQIGYKCKKDQLDISVKRTNWISVKKGPTGYQCKMNHIYV